MNFLFLITCLTLLAIPGVLDAQEKPNSETVLMADLDALLDFSVFWKSSQANFETLYVPRVENQEKEPQFEWLTTGKDRARFSRQMFSNMETHLTLFRGEVKPEEAIVEFVKGKAARSTISISNRDEVGQYGSL